MSGQILKIFFRNLLRYRIISGINFLGLAVGMAAFLLISHYVSFEKQFDKFHPNSDRTFRVIMTKEISGEVISKGPDNYPALAEVLKEKYPGIQAIEKLMYSSRGGGLVTFETAKGKFLRDDLKSISASPSFFEIFSLGIEKGSYEQLEEPFKVLLSDKLAQVIYPDQNPVGKFIQEDDGRNYEIIGVFDKWDGNSHLDFDVIRSYESIGARHNSDLHRVSWDWPRIKIYLTLEEGVDVSEFEANVLNVINEHKTATEGIALNEVISLQPIEDIRLKSNFESNGPFDQADVKVAIFMSLGFVILIMAWINFTNLSIAYGLDRVKESGIRKVLGASGAYIMRQQFVESLAINGLACLLALSIYQISLPMFHEFTEIPNSFTDGLGFYLMLTGGVILGSLLVAIYPAFVLSRLDVISALKKKISRLGRGVVTMRNALSSTQFAISLTLLIVILAVYKQLDHLKSIDPGTKIEGVLVVKEPRNFDYDQFSSDPDVIKNEWKRIPGIEMVASSYAVPGGNISAYPTRQVGQPAASNVNIQSHEVDHSFVSLYELEVIEGRDFSPVFPSDEHGLLLNESAVIALGFNTAVEAIGKWVTTPMEGYTRQVIGVVRDYNHLSAHNPKQPIMFSLDTESRGYYSLQFSVGDLSTLVDQVEQTFNQVFPDNIFHSFFLEDYYNAQFKREKQLGILLTLFTTIAIVLAAMGLVSITFFTVLRRMKEMSIRKVLGAHFKSLVRLFSRDGNLSFLMASLIAIPVSYLLITKWLESFDSRISLSFMTFSFPAIVLYIMALTAMLLVIIKAARTNPIDTLREE